jgi:hypothetical protein
VNVAARGRWRARVDAWAELLGEACTLLIGYVPDPHATPDTHTALDAPDAAGMAGLCACPACVARLLRQVEAARPIPPG